MDEKNEVGECDIKPDESLVTAYTRIIPLTRRCLSSIRNDVGNGKCAKIGSHG